MNVRQADVAEPARDHDGLVVAAHLGTGRTGHFHLKGAEIARQVGAAEFVVEGCASDGPLQHDVERGGDAARFAEVLLPGLHGPGQAQVRDGEAGEPSLGLGPAAHGAFVANLAARSGGRPGVRRDRGRVVVRLDLHQNADRLAMEGVDVGFRRREEALRLGTLHDGGIVFVRGQHAPRAGLAAAPDHLEERLGLLFAVEDEVGVEDLVTAVLAVGLGEHHQLDIRRVAAQGPETFRQVVDLVGSQRQAQRRIGGFDGSAAFAQQVDGL